MGPHTHPPDPKSFYKEAITGSSQGHRADVLNTTSLAQDQDLGAVSEKRNHKWNPQSKDRAGGGLRSLHVPGASSRTDQQSHLSGDIPQRPPCD